MREAGETARLAFVSDSIEQAETIRFLSEPHNYGPDVHAVERHETHGAIVFLAGDRAYKLKRAVRFPYMDYSTVERRRDMCARELAVNRRTAPMFYLDTWPIVRDAHGLRFGRPDDADNAIDWVVVMRRFDQSALLESLRRAGHLTPELVRRVAETIARFHAEADVTGEFSSEDGLRAVISNSLAMFKPRIGQPFRANAVEDYEKAAHEMLAKVAGLLEERRQTGHVRRCHGDLHLNNIFVHEGSPILFDAIEFEDRFVYIDVLYDLAFLLMDLDRYGLREHANVVLNRYLELSGQHAGLVAMKLFLSCRAGIRAHTSVSAGEATHDRKRRLKLLGDARALLDKAIDYLNDDRPRLIAIGGLSGTGKSTLARNLAPRLGTCPGAIVIRSDAVRKQIMGVKETVRLPQSAYTPEMSIEVYKRMTDIASATLASGFTVIADAVYGMQSERDDIAVVARRASVRFDGLWLDGPTALLEQRIAARTGDASDATPDVLRAQLGFVSAPKNWHSIKVAMTPDDAVAEAERLLALESSARR